MRLTRSSGDSANRGNHISDCEAKVAENATPGGGSSKLLTTRGTSTPLQIACQHCFAALTVHCLFVNNYHPLIRVFTPSKCFDDDEGHVVARAAPARPLVDVVVDVVNHVAGAAFAAGLYGFHETLATVLLAFDARRLGRAVGVEDEHLAGIYREVVFVVARVFEEADGEAAALDEARTVVGVEDEQRVVAGVDEGEGAVGRVKHSVEGRDELVRLD